MRALSIRQPFAELVLRGIKTIEYRTWATTIIGERFWIYASKSKDEVRRMKDEEDPARQIWSNDLAVPGRRVGEPPKWLLQLAELVILDKLPRGVIVGSAVIEKVTRPDPTKDDGLFQWHLVDVARAKRLRKPTGRPQPSWFKPF